MAKSNPFATKRAPTSTFVREIVSRAEPFNTYKFTVRNLSSVELLDAMSLGTELAAKYAGDAANPPREWLPPVDGQPVLVSKSACMVVAIVLTAQAGPVEDRYNEHEIFAMLADQTVGWERRPCTGPDGSQIVVDGVAMTEEVRLDSCEDQICALSDDCSPQDKGPATDPLA